MNNFIHLRTHSEFSVTDGILRVKDIVKYANNDEMVAVGLTDLNNMFGFVKFYKACMDKGIKPILGAEIYVIDAEKFTYRLIILAKNILGLRILNTLITRAYTENKVFDVPHVKEEWLFSVHINDIIILSGGIYGDIANLIVQKKSKQATAKVKKWHNHFGNNYYIELQRIIHPNTNLIVEESVHIAHALGVAVVATHPVEFAVESDFDAHEVRVCIADGETLDNEKRVSRFSKDQYFLTQANMIERFSDIPSAISNSVEIAKRCNVEIIFGKYFLPDFPTANGMDIDDYLTKLSKNGLNIRLQQLAKNPLNGVECQVYFERLELEIKTIIQMGFSGYFLIVADFINWAKNNNVPVGPGRGSGAGSLVAFALGITDIEPLRYGLIFERFLNPERVSMPDFDIDFCQDKRELVIEYVKNKYGSDAVSQIATFGTMSSKAVIKDVGRALGLPYGLCDSLSKLILNTPAKSFSLLEACGQFPDLKLKIDNADEDVKRLWSMSLRLEDLTRNVGKHAAGVLIAPGKLTDFCPLYVADGMQTAQLDKDDVELVGLVKFDFLGLRNLTIIQESLENIKELYQKDIKLSQYDFDDNKTYKLLQDGNTSAVFQLESPGMKRVLVKLKPDRFEDIIALLALYRPGPLGSGMVDDFIRRKNGLDLPNYFHDKLKSCLESTYGVIVYQEQVMQISQIIGGYTLGGADLLRRAMGKKKPEEMAKHQGIFVDGAITNGYTKELAIELFDLMAKFAEYGFNKSHSAAYAVISYHTAYLKAHYSTCFMAATLSSELHNTDKIYELYQDCLSNKITLLPPDINQSGYKFTATSDNEIRYGLGAIKGIGKNVIELIVNEKLTNGSYNGFVDFCERVDKKVINKKTLESLVKAGCFDCFDKNRAKYYSAITDIVSGQNKHAIDENQASLFDDIIIVEAKNSVQYSKDLPNIREWTLKEMLQMEKSALGYYFSASLFDQYKDLVKKLGINPLSIYSLENEEMLEIANSRLKEKRLVLVCGIIQNIGNRALKKGGKVYFINIEDDVSDFEFVIFNDDYEKYKELIKVDNFVFVEGELIYDSFREQIKVTARSIYNLDDILIDKIKQVTLHIDNSINESKLESLFSEEGQARVTVRYSNSLASCDLEFGSNYKLVINYENMLKLSEIIGKDSWNISI